MERDLKEKLERNIWITRKCRINASERLLKSAKFVEFLNVYYSIFVITLSLLSLCLLYTSREGACQLSLREPGTLTERGKKSFPRSVIISRRKSCLIVISGRGGWL